MERAEDNQGPGEDVNRLYASFIHFYECMIEKYLAKI